MIPALSYQERARTLCMKFCRKDMKIDMTNVMIRVGGFQENTMFNHSQLDRYDKTGMNRLKV